MLLFHFMPVHPFQVLHIGPLKKPETKIKSLVWDKWWDSQQHHWVQNGLSHQANHEGPVRGKEEEKNLHDHFTSIISETEFRHLFILTCCGCEVQTYAPLVQEHQPLREHQPHPKEKEVGEVWMGDLLFNLFHCIQLIDNIMYNREEVNESGPWIQRLQSLPLNHQDLDNPRGKEDIWFDVIL